MARGQTLSTIRARLKAELRDEQAVNSSLDSEYNYALDHKQKDLANAYDWPFLQDRWDLSLSAGSRYSTLPTTNIRSISSTINFERPVLVHVKYNTYYQPLEQGIGPAEYNAVHEGTLQNPVQRWAMDTNIGDTTSPNEIEVWPVPASDQIIRFTAQRAVRDLSADADIADLDDLLLIYMVAADYMTMRQQTNAPLMVAKANAHLTKLLASYPRRSERIILGGQHTLDRRNVKLIATA